MPTICDTIARSGIDRLDAEILLAHTLGVSRSFVITHAQEQLPEEKKNTFDPLADRRKNEEPVAYLTGQKEFYGRTFAVRPGIFIPRPSTEILIDEVKKIIVGDMHSEKTPHITPADTGIVVFTYLKDECSMPRHIIDIGTGSGCIGITLAVEFPDLRVIATDIAEDTLAIARENAKCNNVLDRMTFMKANILKNAPTHHAPLTTHPFLIVTNPPYIPEGTPLPRTVQNFEPPEALFAGPTGMDIIEEIVSWCILNPLCRGCVIECREEQAKKIAPRL